MTEKELLTLNEVARLLGVSLSTVKRRVKDKTIPVTRLRYRVVRVRRTDLEAVLQSGTTEPAPRRPESRRRQGPAKGSGGNVRRRRP